MKPRLCGFPVSPPSLRVSIEKSFSAFSFSYSPHRHIDVSSVSKKFNTRPLLRAGAKARGGFCATEECKHGWQLCSQKTENRYRSATQPNAFPKNKGRHLFQNLHHLGGTAPKMRGIYAFFGKATQIVRINYHPNPKRPPIYSRQQYFLYGKSSLF